MRPRRSSERSEESAVQGGVVWADCLRLAQHTPVLLISQDKGFYEGRDYSKGLAANLLREAASG
jgi:hypothetical protein